MALCKGKSTARPFFMSNGFPSFNVTVDQYSSILCAQYQRAWETSRHIWQNTEPLDTLRPMF